MLFPWQKPVFNVYAYSQWEMISIFVPTWKKYWELKCYGTYGLNAAPRSKKSNSTYLLVDASVQSMMAYYYSNQLCWRHIVTLHILLPGPNVLTYTNFADVITLCLAYFSPLIKFTDVITLPCILSPSDQIHWRHNTVPSILLPTD
jgi:hypothetical protein